MIDVLIELRYMELTGQSLDVQNSLKGFYNLASAKDNEDTSMPFTTARVDEVYQRSRKYHSLHVTIKPEIFVYTWYPPKGDIMEVA